MVFRWFQDWRDRRAALRDLRKNQHDAEAVLMDQVNNPINLAKLTLERNEVEAAAAHWERARVLVPEAVLTSTDSLEILLGLKRYEEAELLMRERGAKLSRDRFYLVGLAKIAEQRDGPEEALRRWEAARERARDESEVYLGCGRCLMVLDRLDEAEVQFKTAVRRTTQPLFPLLECARISDRRRDWPESLVRWKYIFDTFNFPAALASYASALAELGRHDEAEAVLEEPSRSFPRDLAIAVTRAHFAERRGDLVDICDRWAAVRWADPYFHSGYLDGVRWLTEAGRDAEADAVLRTAIERFPDEVWPVRDFARLAHGRHDWNEAAERWAILRQRFPDEEIGYSSGAEALRAAGRDAEAIALHRD